ncbi:hypothetical protein L227DRAFT_653772 [Lentinus tigrinus ALCF2SS1-6]|uniref:Uncharacterized protein n=1 Tax=Lentinus tigrinus ALCF2SS1-6 TaxID=1328759 RepID=A0A5C2S9U8_9APHY|nr:hypothetical protein L227DRAFT_653772 [Lentinus tigrinus ALCF2SS1-6]
MGKLASLVLANIRAWCIRHRQGLFGAVQSERRMSFHILSALACVYPSSSPLAPFVQVVFVFALFFFVDRSALKSSFTGVHRALLTRVKASKIAGSLAILTQTATKSAANYVLGIDIVQLLKDLDALRTRATQLNAELTAKDKMLEEDGRTIRRKDRALAYKDSTIRAKDRELVFAGKEMRDMQERMTEKDAALTTANTKLEWYTRHVAEVNDTPTLIPEGSIAIHPLFQILSRANHSLVNQADKHKREREQLQATVSHHREEWARLHGQIEELGSQLASSRAACTILESKATGLFSRVKELEKTCEKRASAYARLARENGVQELLDKHHRLKTEVSSYKMDLETCRANERSAREKVEELQLVNGQLTAAYHVLRDEMKILQSTR